MEQRKPRADVETLLTSQTISSLGLFIPLAKRQRPEPSSLPCAGGGLRAAGAEGGLRAAGLREG